MLNRYIQNCNHCLGIPRDSRENAVQICPICKFQATTKNPYRHLQVRVTSFSILPVMHWCHSWLNRTVVSPRMWICFWLDINGHQMGRPNFIFATLMSNLRKKEKKLKMAMLTYRTNDQISFYIIIPMIMFLNSGSLFYGKVGCWIWSVFLNTVFFAGFVWIWGKSWKNMIHLKDKNG